ncbi:hypothetical protein [Salinibacter altiplanensis]|uniref:hypothetical protein n=1 Tax=Salinibacter altiplanensis TaxID=1803181 RepID=UPI000C9F5F4D|nr:hypothetical protein [Salinibacter altiplanensis]
MGYEPRGRPRKAPGEKLSKEITVKLTPSKKKIIKKEAGRCGMDTSELIRGVLLRVLKERVQEESKAEGPEKEPEEDSGGSGPNGSESYDSESDFRYPKPVPEDFRELTSFLSETRARAKSSEDIDNLRGVLDDFRFQLKRWIEKYQKWFREIEKIKRETQGETRGTTDIEKKTEQITFRVRPKDHAWLEEMHARDKSIDGGLSTSIRSIVGAWIQDGTLLRDLNEYLMSKWMNAFDQLRKVEEPSEMREEIISFADGVEDKIEGEVLGTWAMHIATYT